MSNETSLNVYTSLNAIPMMKKTGKQFTFVSVKCEVIKGSVYIDLNSVLIDFSTLRFNAKELSQWNIPNEMSFVNSFSGINHARISHRIFTNKRKRSH